MIEFLQTYWWGLAAAAGAFLLFAIIFLALAVKNKKRYKKLKADTAGSTERIAALEAETESLKAEVDANAKRQKIFDEKLAEFERREAAYQEEHRQLEELLRAKNTVGAGTAGSKSADFGDGDSEDPPLHLDDVIEPEIFVSTGDGDDIEVRSVAKNPNSKTGGEVKYSVKFDRLKNDWTVRKEGSERAIRRAATKEEAVKIARDLARKNNANLVLHKKDGKFQKQR